MNKKIYNLFGSSVRSFGLKFLCGIMVLSSLTVSLANAQSGQSRPINVTFTILEEDGLPVVGATVVLTGSTTKVSISDVDGKAILRDVPSNGTVKVSYTGMVEQTLAINGLENMKVVMKSSTILMDDVVVVGYGTQKKVNLSGAVVSVDVSTMLDSRPVTNISSALAGMSSGVYIAQTNNRPSNNGAASITIRGTGTMNTTSPLIIIDGVESSLNTVNPADVENISILKDASSSSIYGSRAANGVILVTTKKGKSGVSRFSYNGYVSFESMKKNFDVISNYADYMGYLNEGLLNSGKPKQFSDNIIETWRAHENDPESWKYPNNNILDFYEVGVAQQHNVSATGGSDKVTYFASFGYSDNPGVMINTGYERYNMRVNLDAKINNWFKVGTNLSGYTATSPAASDNIDDAFTYGLTGGNPGIAWKDDQGRLGINSNNEDDPQNATNNPYVRLMNVDGNIRYNNIKTRFYAILQPIKGLTIQGSYNFSFYNQTKKSKPKFVELWDFQRDILYSDGVGRTSIYNYDTKEYKNFMDGTISYDRNFFNDKLSMLVMGGASQEQYYSDNFNLTRYDLFDPSLWVPSGAYGEYSGGGGATDWAMRSFFGRVNLGWDDKYLVEMNIRADGSSRFASDNRWGYFPSASAAWRVSEENFMKDFNWLQNLKLRASYGSLGNNAISNYEWQSSYSSANYVLGRAVNPGLAMNSIANSIIKWETTYSANIGLDFAVLNNRLSGTVEAYHKRTYDILVALPIPAVHGNASVPRQNAGQVTNKGIEVSFDWKDKIGSDFSYNASVNFSYNWNNVDKYRGDYMNISGGRVLTEGLPMWTSYILQADYIIETDEQLAKVQEMIDANPLNADGSKKTVFPYGTPKKGDLMYKDANGDGAINDDDRVLVGSGTSPKFLYGMNLSASWKGIDFGMVIQGMYGLLDSYQSALYQPSVRVGYQLNKEIIEGRWYEGRTTPATYPRLLEYSNNINKQASDFWVMNRAYLKIRNIQLGYTLPKTWSKTVNMEKVRVYGSLENFFTLTKWKGFDPEFGGISYPSMKQAVIGIDITF